MRVPVHKQIWSWGAVAAVVALALWGLGNVMTPFLIGAGIAYVLDPLADRLERSGLSRTWAVALITLIAVLAFLLAMVLLVPMVIRQLAQLIEAAPGYFQALQVLLSQQFPERFPEGGTVRSALNDIAAQMSQMGGQVLSTVLSSVRNLISVVLLAVIVPVVAFYLLLDWDRMVARIDALLPREHADTIRGIALEINDSMSGFLRGQGLVTLILATFYSTSLLAVGLPFALVIGISAAVLSIIPYVGVFTGGVTSVAVAAFTFWDDPKWIIAVLAIFVVGQIVEGNYLQPKIIGGHVGLHPVWLMIALAVFGKLFGFVGLVVAVPLGAIIGVLVRFFIDRYKESALYTGSDVIPEPPPPVLIEVVPPGTTAEVRRRAQAAHLAAVQEVKIELARQAAREAAAEAAQRDGAHLAEASVEVPPVGPEGSVQSLDVAPEVRTWGGKTPDGTDPDDPKGKSAASQAEAARKRVETAVSGADRHPGPAADAALAKAAETAARAEAEAARKRADAAPAQQGRSPAPPQDAGPTAGRS
ncbi:AI-2E family transporter [Paracoccus endophyticus]|uniref:AI-2E family transporter n=1 Tax=Paracoccus endophyticus TaxID=2233774 RepID=UPI001981C48B|nr:AI-2E family transporter [Paracoccus endophyticus]